MKNCLVGLLFLTFFGCTGTELSVIKPLTVSERDSTPCNPNASDNTKAVLAYLADLSADPFQGVIAGQNCGHTEDIYNPESMMSYAEMVEQLHTDTGKWVGLIGVDYGHNRIFKPSELSQANEILIDYWNAGGLVAVGWSPLNPWLNDGTDLDNNPGVWTDTRTNEGLTESQLAEIDLNKLIDPNEEIHNVWRNKLDRIAAALQELEDAGVVVLFKPMQEQNGFWFWWGCKSHPNDPSPYINLYRDMYNYFTNEKGLDNILWMYSPNRNEINSSPPWVYPQMWVYPGDDYIDIVAPTVYNNDLRIFDYQEFIETGKPMGMAEFGPHHDGNVGAFDNLNYINSIQNEFTGMAFWISWHDWDNGDGTNTYMSLIGNNREEELLTNSLVITREKLQWREYLPISE